MQRCFGVIYNICACRRCIIMTIDDMEFTIQPIGAEIVLDKPFGTLLDIPRHMVMESMLFLDGVSIELKI